MTDNIAVTPGAGATVATDDVGGVHYQVNKLAYGIADSATLVSDTDPFPIDAMSMPAAATTTDNLGAAAMTNVVMNGVTELTPKFASATVSASQTDFEIVAAVTSKIIRVLSLAHHTSGTATTATYETGGATRVHKVPAGANGGQILPFNPVGWFQTASGAALTITTGTGSDTEVTLTYLEV